MRAGRASLVVGCCALLALLEPRPAHAVGPPQANKLTISSAGINVPKRTALIAGLNQQFKSRRQQQQQANSTLALEAPAGVIKIGALLAGGGRLGPRSSRPADAPAASDLHFERQQQELLAANPNLAAANLQTRSDLAAGAAANLENQRAHAPDSSSSSGGLVKRLMQRANQAAANQTTSQTSGGEPGAQRTPVEPASEPRDKSAAGLQQSYRGFSLIELEVKSEHDRRYVQELYGNLSAALNEQAQRPQSLAVSPYVDIDFWSFKSALNDQVDIMVSPKSRAFILAQLARAKIKHRVKIDDMQTRLEQQQPEFAPGQLPSAAINYAGHELSGRQSGAGAGAGGAPQGPALQARQQPLLVGANGLANDSAFFENYQRLADINAYLESLVARARDVARVQVIGRSSQGRYLRVLHLGHGLDGELEPEPEAELEPAPADGEQLEPPGQLNASHILRQFMRRQAAVKKVGSLWLDGGTHAREWISPATVLYMAFRLADNHAKCLRFFDHIRTLAGQQAREARAAAAAAETEEPQLDSDLANGINEINSSLLSGHQAPRTRSQLDQKLELLAKRPQALASEHACDLELEQLLRKYTFYVMPVLNPDGYEYSHTHNRLWRKTRSTSSHPIYRHFCLGADPNRNYDARHGSAGSSSHPCSQTYGGLTPFTEPETRHQTNFVYAHRDSLKMYISFHSYSQMILLPFSHSKQLAPDFKDLESVGQAGAQAIEQTHGVQYKVGPSASILYTASGTASDWAYEKAGIKYSYTMELRDTGTFGFLLPRQQILPTGEETFNGLLAMIKRMELNDHLLSSKSDAGLAGALLAPARWPAANSSAGLVHAPDIDQLRPFGRFRTRPAQLENALDGSQTWATPEPRPPGVRDRAPASADQLAGQYERISAEEEPLASSNQEEPDAGLAFEGEGELMEPTNNLSVNSALNGQSSDAAAHSAAQLMGQIYAQQQQKHDHHQQDQQEQELDKQQLSSAGLQLAARYAASPTAGQLRQRIQANQLGLSANGRSLINSPPGQARSTSPAPRRELSSEF